jgi:hypothetical protein
MDDLGRDHSHGGTASGSVLAANAKLWAAIVPGRVEQCGERACEDTHGQSARMSWARLLKRVFDHRINCTLP